MQTMRESWTDERLDDLKREMHEGFRRIDDRFDQIADRFDQVGERFDQIDKRLNRVEDGFFALQRTLMATGAAMIVGLFGLLVTQL